MPDSQRYPVKLCLINNEKDIAVCLTFIFCFCKQKSESNFTEKLQTIKFQKEKNG